MLTTSLQRFIATCVVLLVLLVGGYFLFVNKATAPAPEGGTPTATSTNATSTGGVSNKPVLNTPDYKKPIAFSANISADIRTQLNSSLKTVQNQIAANPLNMGAWVNLGTLHKQGGDYQNAALYWEFVTSTYTGNATPYYSLGELYMNYLHDNTKAEFNYKEAIKINKNNVNAYADLFTLYHYTLKDDTKAAAVLEAGLKANPNNNYLLGLQSDLQAK